jgi:hypothetical protein
MRRRANGKVKRRGHSALLSCLVLLAPLLGCGELTASPAPPASTRAAEDNPASPDSTPRLALWLAKKNELTASAEASYDVVLTSWFEPAEAALIKPRNPSMKFLAGLSHTWILDDPAWLKFLLTVANGGDASGPLQITEDMYLRLDENHAGVPGRKCSPPGREKIYAMDPRHPAWRKLILAFYRNAAEQPQHDGVCVDMVDAYPFCDGAWSSGVQTPLNAETWASAQDELLGLIREATPQAKWVVANAGRDFAAGLPFPRHLNGYVLENFLGSWGAGLEAGLASAQRALETTQPPHMVIFAVDTDDTGEIDWARFRVGLAASLLLDNTFFAFDYGSRDHGGVTDWWFPEYYGIDLGKPLGPYSNIAGGYRRDFEKGVVIVAAESEIGVLLQAPHSDIANGKIGTAWAIPKGDARILLQLDEP